MRKLSNSAYADCCTDDWTYCAAEAAERRRRRRALKKLYGRVANERGASTIGQVLFAYAVSVSLVALYALAMQVLQ